VGHGHVAAGGADVEHVLAVLDGEREAEENALVRALPSESVTLPRLHKGLLKQLSRRQVQFPSRLLDSGSENVHQLLGAHLPPLQHLLQLHQAAVHHFVRQIFILLLKLENLCIPLFHNSFSNFFYLVHPVISIHPLAPLHQQNRSQNYRRNVDSLLLI